MMLALRHQDVKFGFACACSDLQAARDPEPLAPLGFRVKHSGRPFRPPMVVSAHTSVGGSGLARQRNVKTYAETDWPLTQDSQPLADSSVLPPG